MFQGKAARPCLFTGSSGRTRRKRRSFRSTLEALEGRVVLSSGAAALPSGVDSLALGDVNGAQLADIAVAGREGGNYVVNIYDSRGQANLSSSTGWTPNLVATLVNPLGVGVGPLSIALGDFDGSGTSQLAVTASESIKGQKPEVAIYQFSLAAGTPPIGAPVTPELMTSFTPAGMESAAGLQLAAFDILFINPSKTPGEASDPSACTHAITWLGHFGVDANGMYPNLIVDSTGNQPAHVDSNNHEIPGGVHVRPFAAPNAEGLNMWYFEHVDHVLRLVVSS
jgi:hypothetical protein